MDQIIYDNLGQVINHGDILYYQNNFYVAKNCYHIPLKSALSIYQEYQMTLTQATNEFNTVLVVNHLKDVIRQQPDLVDVITEHEKLINSPWPDPPISLSTQGFVEKYARALNKRCKSGCIRHTYNYSSGSYTKPHHIDTHFATQHNALRYVTELTIFPTGQQAKRNRWRTHSSNIFITVRVPEGGSVNYPEPLIVDGKDVWQDPDVTEAINNLEKFVNENT